MSSSPSPCAQHRIHVMERMCCPSHKQELKHACSQPRSLHDGTLHAPPPAERKLRSGDWAMLATVVLSAESEPVWNPGAPLYASTALLPQTKASWNLNHPTTLSTLQANMPQRLCFVSFQPKLLTSSTHHGSMVVPIFAKLIQAQTPASSHSKSYETNPPSC